MRKFLVYYNAETGEIKAITPAKEELFSDFACTQIPFETAFKFLNGEYTTQSWYVASCSTEQDGVLTQDQFDFQLQVDDKLTMIPRKDYMLNVTSAIEVTLIPIDSRVEISVPDVKFPMNLKDREDMIFYVTKRNDPSEVYATFSVNPEELFEKKKISFPFDAKVRDCSVYTKKMFRFYQMSIQHTRKKMNQIGSSVRQNTLVNYRYTKKAITADNGINVIHKINNGTLELYITGDTSHIPHYINSAMILLTKPRDPTVLIKAITFNIQELIDNGRLTINLPDDIGENFGIAGYPYMEQLTFTRK